VGRRFENETVYFGKYKGRTFGEIAQDHVLYLDWLVGQKWFESRYPETFHRLLEFLNDTEIEQRLRLELGESEEY
jgi:hypothetical protein